MRQFVLAPDASFDQTARASFGDPATGPKSEAVAGKGAEAAGASLNDPFAVLGLPRRFELDASALRRAHLSRAAKWHPDRFSDPRERAAAEVMSAQVNEAHRLLSDPERRADTLLRLLSGPAAEAHHALPDGFLMDIFEVRQELEEAIATGDTDAKARLEAWAADERDRHIREVGAAFASLSAPADAAALEAIRTQMNAWRYIERMMEQLHATAGPTSRSG